MNMTKKILIIHTIIIGSFLLGIGGVLAKEGCTSDDQCKEKNPKTPYWTVAGPNVIGKTIKHCAEIPLRNPTPASKPAAQEDPCDKTLKPQKPTQSPAETQKPSLPETKPNNSLFDQRITCAIQEAQKNNYLNTAFIKCIKWGDLVTCANHLLKNPTIASKCNNTKANIFDALWNFVIHRK